MGAGWHARPGVHHRGQPVVRSGSRGIITVSSPIGKNSVVTITNVANAIDTTLSEAALVPRDLLLKEPGEQPRDDLRLLFRDEVAAVLNPDQPEVRGFGRHRSL